MTPMAISLGLIPPDAKERSRVCRVVSVDEVIHEGSLPANHVYVDQGHHRHRLPTTKWAPPCTPGVNCSTDDWLAFYVTHIRETLWDNLSELQHKVLVSDTGGGPIVPGDSAGRPRARLFVTAGPGASPQGGQSSQAS